MSNKFKFSSFNTGLQIDFTIKICRYTLLAASLLKARTVPSNESYKISDKRQKMALHNISVDT